MSVCVAYPTNVGALNFCWKTALKSLAKKLPRLQASKLQEVLQHEVGPKPPNAAYVNAHTGDHLQTA